MKRILTMLFLITITITLSACSEQGTNNVEVLSSRDALVSMSYLSAGFLDTASHDVSAATGMSLMDYLNTDTEVDPETEFETEIDELNIYLEKLKGFIENGPSGLGSVVEETSDRVDYDNMITLTVEDETYILYYSIDEQGNITGIFVIGVVEYVIEATNSLEDSQESSNDEPLDDEETCDPTVDEDCDQEEPEDEEEASLEDKDDEDENEQKMVLVATNGMDSITITYKVETEEDEQTTKFELEKDIDGIVSEVSIKISLEEDEYKIEISDGENEYSFKQETEDGETMYKLQYVVNGVRGQVKIKIRVDEFGEEYYAYQIIENGKNSSTERGKPESYGWGDDDEDDETDENNEGSEENSDEGSEQA